MYTYTNARECFTWTPPLSENKLRSIKEEEEEKKRNSSMPWKTIEIYQHRRLIAPGVYKCPAFYRYGKKRPLDDGHKKPCCEMIWSCVGGPSSNYLSLPFSAHTIQ